MKHVKTRLTILLCVLSVMLLCLGLAACGTKTYTVTVSETTNGTVTLSPEAEGNKYEENAKVEVTVTPATGYKVDTFTVSTDEDAALTENKYTLTVTADTTISATFKQTVTPPPATDKFSITKNSPENGSIDVSPAADSEGKYAKDTEITVTLTPAQGYEVATFTVGGVDKKADLQNNVYKFNVTADTAITATFEAHVHERDTEKGLQQGETTHWYLCRTCGEKMEETAHTAKDETYLKDDDNNKHYQLCECGAKVNESEHNLKINSDKTKFECEQCDYEVAHTHDTQLQDAGESGHKTVCKTEGCGYESEVTAHAAKDETYLKDEDNNRHYQLCECGARVNEAEHAAAEGAEWKQDTENNQHYKECVCGEHVNVAAHTAKDDTYQQDTENNKHYQLCECGAKVNEAEHTAKDDKWLHDDGDQDTGKHYQLCVCGEKVHEDTHDIDPEAYSDGESGHHFECTVCDFKTETEAHKPNADGVVSKNGEQHSYRCDDCNEEVVEAHDLSRYDFTNEMYEYCYCTKCEYRIGWQHELHTVSDSNGTHHTECQGSLWDCTYRTDPVPCDMEWTKLENEAEGHKGNCPTCGYTVESEPHDELGEGGKCSKCGYKKIEEHICKDEPVNGFYDGICDICGNNFNNTWTFDAATGTINSYNGAYGKVYVPVKIDDTSVKVLAMNSFGQKTVLTDVFIPEDSEITTLNINTFGGSANLQSIVILSQNITSLPMAVAGNCQALSYIVLSKTITTIGANAFLMCSKLETVYFMGDSATWQIVSNSDTTLQGANVLFYKGQSGGDTEWHWDVDKVTPKPWKEV